MQSMWRFVGDVTCVIVANQVHIGCLYSPCRMMNLRGSEWALSRLGPKRARDRWGVPRTEQQDLILKAQYPTSPMAQLVMCYSRKRGSFGDSGANHADRPSQH